MAIAASPVEDEVGWVNTKRKPCGDRLLHTHRTIVTARSSSDTTETTARIRRMGAILPDEPHQFLKFLPNMIGEAGGHRRRDAEGLVNIDDCARFRAIDFRGKVV